MFRIYRFDTSCYIDNDIFRKHMGLLSAEGRKRIDSYRSEAVRYSNLGASFLLYHAFTEAGLSYNSMEEMTYYGRFGKPYSRLPSVYFNASHSGNMAMLIISMDEKGIADVGCDIEKIRPRNERLYKRYSTPEEVDYIESQGTERNTSFIRMWTIKEAFLKTLGTGLTVPLNSFSIKLNDELSISQTLDEREYILGELPVMEGYASSWCVALDGTETDPNIIPEIVIAEA